MPGPLDDTQRFSRVDRGDMLGSIYRLADPFLNPRQFRSKSTGRRRVVDDLVFVGMGGSASAGDVLTGWGQGLSSQSLSREILVCRDLLVETH